MDVGAFIATTRAPSRAPERWRSCRYTIRYGKTRKIRQAIAVQPQGGIRLPGNGDRFERKG